MSASLKRWLLLALLTSILVPVGVFLGGWLLAGSYAGAGGVFGLMGEIYGDAAAGEPGAWLLLAAPFLLVGIWIASFKLHRSIKTRTSPRADSAG